MAALALAACGGGGGSPSPPTISISGFGPNGNSTTLTLFAATTYSLTASETGSGGGAVTPGPLTIALSNAAIGTVTGNTLVTGTLNESGTVTVRDSKTGLSAKFTVTVLSSLPATVSDTLTLTGTLTHTIARPLPAPTAVASPVTTLTKVSDVLKIASTNATFGAQTGLRDYNVVETDTAPLQTLGITSDTYAGFVAAGSTQDFFQFGSTSTDTNGVTDATTYGSGNGQLDELPDVDGATWTNNAALTFKETEPDGTTIARTTAAAGTYTETDDYLGITSGTTQANADLSASITSFGGLDINVTYGAPAGSGASATIPYSVVFGSEYGIAPINGTLADWFPTTTISSDSFVKTTGSIIPCAIPSSVATGGTAVAETTTHLDTGLGTYEKRTQTVYYVPGYGSVCAVLADTIDTYYDYTGQTPGVIGGLDLALSSNPVQIDTLSETLGFSLGSVSGSSVARRSAQSLGTNVAVDEAFHAVGPIFDRAVKAVYRARRDAVAANLTRQRAALAALAKGATR